MTQMREAEQLLRGYLAEGPAQLSERTYVTVRTQIERTPQRRTWWRSDVHVSPRLKLAFVAATLAIALLVVIRSLKSPYVIGPGSSPTPTPTPTAVAAPTAPLPTAIGSCSLTLTEFREVRGGDPEAPEPFEMTAPYHAAMQAKTNKATAAMIGAHGSGWGEDGPGRPVVSLFDPDGALLYPGVGLSGGVLDTTFDFDKPGTWTLWISAPSVGCTQAVQILIEPEPSPTPPPTPSAVGASSRPSSSP
jgi:hypothetical protein